MGRKDISDRRKPEILEAYFQVLLQEGIEGASIKKIADYMGIHPSHVLHYFSNKDELAISLMDHMINRYENEFLLQYESENDPEKRLDLIIDQILFPEEFREDIHMAITALKYMATRKADVASAMQQMYNRFKKHMLDEFTHMMKAKLIPGKDPDMLVDMLLLMSNGYKESQPLIKDNRDSHLFYNHVKQTVMNILYGKYTDTYNPSRGQPQ